MAQRLKLVKGAARRSALIYGMRLYDPRDVVSVDDAQIKMTDGSASRITMHFIEGTKEQIRRQLMQSVDAFFELMGDE
jgi:hypothetical protein